MMRWLSIFLSLLLTLLSAGETPPATEGREILYATPEVDGVLDEAYTESYSYSVNTEEHFNFGDDYARAQMASTHGTAYYLYDDEYLYICATVHDETLITLGEEWRYATVWPWNDDGAELYVSFAEDNSLAVHIDAFGYRAVVDEKIWGDNHATAKIYHDAADEDFATTVTETDYVVEIRIALPEGMTAGDTVGVLLEIDDRFSTDAISNNASLGVSVIGALFPFPRDPSATNFQAVLAAPAQAEEPFAVFAVKRLFSILPY